MWNDKSVEWSELPPHRTRGLFQYPREGALQQRLPSVRKKRLTMVCTVSRSCDRHHTLL